MVLGTILTKISVASMLAATLPTSVVTATLPSTTAIQPTVAIVAPTDASHWQAVAHLGEGASLDFTKISLTARDLVQEDDLIGAPHAKAAAFDDTRNIVRADAYAGTSLKYYNIATFTLEKGVRLTKENKPTLFGEKVLTELTGITIAK